MLRCCLDMAANKNNKGERETKIENSTSTEASQISSPQQQYGQYQNQQQQQRREQEEEEQHHAINQALDETKDNIRKTTDEARSQIPRYTQSVNDYQEQTIQAAREIADNYLESQKEIINSFQSACTPYMENANRLFWSNWMSPRQASELYANMVSSIADNTIAATRLVNNAIFANMDAFKTSIQHAKENAKEFSRIGVNAAKTFEQTTRDADRSGNTVSGFSVETEGRQRRY
jgi:small-conductance mechanosensitive channel